MHTININTKKQYFYNIDIHSSDFKMKISQIVSKMDYLYV